MNKDAKLLMTFVKTNCDILVKMGKQLTEYEAMELISKYGLEATKTQLTKMNNWRDIKKNRSVYHTCVKWFEMDAKKGFPSGGVQPIRKPELTEAQKAKREFVIKYPIGATIESITGRRFQVNSLDFLEEIPTGHLLPIGNVATKDFTIVSK